MKLVYLQEERVYEVETLRKCIEAQLDCESNRNGREVSISAGSGGAGFGGTKLDEGFFIRLKKSMDRLPKEDRETSVVEMGTEGSEPTFKFKFIGLYDYVDRPVGGDMGTETNLTFFFMPKFVAMPEFENEKTDWSVPRDTIRDTVLQAIDRRNRGLSKSDDQTAETEERLESLLERAVRVLRDYLENGVYTVQRRELEYNGQGEIDWETTIDQYQPVFLKKEGKVRPFYMDYVTELAWSDEDHYITRLHQCLVTTWGRKLEELGLSSVLRVNVPLLSEEELDWFGEPDYQIAQIDRELRLQFVTKSRHTLSLMKDLIRATAENKAANRQSLSFGMNGAAQLWETAIKDVFGNHMEKTPGQLELNGKTKYDKKLKDFIEPPKWTETGVQYDEDDDPASGSRLRPDFIVIDRKNGLLVILDAKYYLPKFEEKNGKKTIRDCPGVGDIDKQFLYQIAFAELCKENNLRVLNAFVFPGDSSGPTDRDLKVCKFATVTEDLFSWILNRIPWAFPGRLSKEIVAFKVDGIALFKAYAEGQKQPLTLFLS